MKDMKKIRYTFEGEVPADFPIYPLPMLCQVPYIASSDNSYSRRTVDVYRAVTVAVEEILPPEPEYKYGQLWQSASGDVYRRIVLFGETGWSAFGSEELYPDSFPSRPLKLIKDV